jgi:Mn-containing catalase
MGGIEPRHFLSNGGGATPADANGVPFSAGYVDAGGNLRADMRANVAAEAIGRTLATRRTRRPTTRHEGHVALSHRPRHDAPATVAGRAEELEDPTNAPGRLRDRGRLRTDRLWVLQPHRRAGAEQAAWTNGPSLDGKGEFHVADPREHAAPRPQLQDAPHDMHRGPEATKAVQAGNGGGGGLMAQMREVLQA